MGAAASKSRRASDGDRASYRRRRLLQISIAPQSCGQLLIDDEEGERVFNTRGGRAPKGLRCIFDFRAGIGRRYRIEHFFLDDDAENHVGGERADRIVDSVRFLL